MPPGTPTLHRSAAFRAEPAIGRQTCTASSCPGLVIIEALAAGWTSGRRGGRVHYMTDNEGPQTTRLQQNQASV